MKKIVGNLVFLYTGDAISFNTCDAFDCLEIVQIDEDLVRIKIPIFVFAELFGEAAADRIFTEVSGRNISIGDFAGSLIDGKS